MIATKPSTDRLPRESFTAALSQVYQLAEQLNAEAHVAGSFLRGRATVKDLDVVIVVPEGRDMLATADSLAMALFGRTGGCRIVRGETCDRLRLDLYLCTPDEFGAMMMFLTGPAGFNVTCRRAAIARGWKLSQYGLHDADGTPVCDASSEAAIFEALGVDYLTPEQRERFA